MDDLDLDFMSAVCEDTVVRYGGRRLSPSQFALMVDYMTLNPELIDGKLTSTFTKEMRTQKWEELASMLNADGTGATKDPEKWRKSWVDQKCGIKARFKQSRGSENYRPSELEIRVLKLLGYRRRHARKRINPSIKIENKSDDDDLDDDNQKQMLNKSGIPESGKKIDIQNTLRQSTVPETINAVNYIAQKTEKTINIQEILRQTAVPETINIQEILRQTAVPEMINTVNYIPQNIGANYILVDLDNATVPLPLNVIQNPLSINTVSANLGFQSIPIIGLESSNVAVKLEETNVLTTTSTPNVLKVHQNVNEVPVRIQDDFSSRIGIEKVQEFLEDEKKLQSSAVDSGTLKSEKEAEQKEIKKKQKDALKLKRKACRCLIQKKGKITKSKFKQKRIFRPTKRKSSLSQCLLILDSYTKQSLKAQSQVPETPGNSSTLGNMQNPAEPEITDNVISASSKKKVLNNSQCRRKNDFGICKLLQKQNNILDGISKTLTRIEKSLENKSSVEIQQKNNMVINISEDIHRLASSLGSLSNSLKSTAEN